MPISGWITFILASLVFFGGIAYCIVRAARS